MSDTSPPQDSEPEGLNPDLKRGHDASYAENQHGSTPLDTISVTRQGPAVWPVIWAVVTLALVAITLFLLFA
jgi:hypothetical protein